MEPVFRYLLAAQQRGGEEQGGYGALEAGGRDGGDSGTEVAGRAGRVCQEVL